MVLWTNHTIHNILISTFLSCNHYYDHNECTVSKEHIVQQVKFYLPSQQQWFTMCLLTRHIKYLIKNIIHKWNYEEIKSLLKCHLFVGLSAAITSTMNRHLSKCILSNNHKLKIVHIPMETSNLKLVYKMYLKSKNHLIV